MNWEDINSTLQIRIKCVRYLLRKVNLINMYEKIYNCINFSLFIFIRKINSFNIHKISTGRSKYIL